MFTGIVEELGTVERIASGGRLMSYTIKASLILEDVKLGDSISVNGVCLTVTSFTKHQFTVDVMPETVKSSSIREWKRGTMVNLERAMGANGRFGGHMVSGHIDGTGVILSKKQDQNAVYFEINTSVDITDNLVMKGSIAVDGISLTIFGLEDGKVKVSIIPHTLSETVLGSKEAGDIVNVECDIIGKYVRKFTSASNRDSSHAPISESFLERHGFK
ncbi:riboflavin synthase [Bacillus sp. FJAT-42376]|uniref:riboflavin synthase n=1 Tax=Bacillus sp. FJAT-42376 TaxID=2014076 RepID=UPI000F4D95CC|nr:riboflavin synthase [Bacillus sp. FJAT-42376]AZB43398.1 riboflavin synthase [Bacillus sp. FJAT-42376]